MTKKLSGRDYETNAMAEIRFRWFREHKATISTCANGVTAILWKSPGTQDFHVRYILWGGTLYVSGDLGSAVYCWGSLATLPFLASCSLDYFMGKCQASETGRQYIEWDDGVAIHRLEDLCKRDGRDDEVAEDSTVFPFIEGIGGEKEACETAAREFNDATGDFETAGQIHRAGEVPNMRAIAHWLGLRMIQEGISAETLAKNLGVAS